MTDSGSSGNKSADYVQQPRPHAPKLERIPHRNAQHQRIDEELDRAWSEWETTFDAIQDSIMLLDGEFNIIQANAATSRLLGRPLDEIVGNKCCRLVHGTDAPPEGCPLSKTVSTKKRHKTELYITQKDMWTIVLVDPILDGEGNVTGLVHLLADITDHKKAEKALRESQEHFRNIFDNALLGLYRTTPDGRILLANPALVRMLGYESFDELARRNLGDEGFEPSYPRSTFKERIEADGRIFGLESAWTRCDGTTLFVRESAIAIRDSQGNTMYYEGTVEDITEQKKAEQAYKALVDHSLQGLVVFQDGRAVFTNEAMAGITGYSVDEMLTLPPEKVQAFVHPENRETVWTRHKKRLNGSKVPEHYECRGIRKDGQLCWLEIHASLIDYQGRPAIQAAFIDITDRKKSEETLCRQTRLLNSINRVLVEGLTCETEADLARTCLAVAEELTASKFGFVCEITPAQLSSTIAISDPGWHACRMPKRDAVVAIENMPIRGIWGKVIQEERAIIFNDPSFDPAWVGIPQGHPKITCFLGVPLKHAGKTIGMIALANKESGYDLADQQDVEALSVSFVEALMRKRAEQQVRQSEQKYKELFESAREAIIIMDLNGKITDANRIVEEYGHTRDYLLGKSIFDFIPFNHRARAAKDFDDLSHGTPVKGEMEVIAPKGNFTVEYRDNPIVRGGQIVAVQAILMDITERKHTEQALRDYQARLKSLAAELALAEERERRRIAAGIHDDIGQKLALAKMELQLLARSPGKSKIPASLDGVCARIDEAIKDAHSLTFELSNPALYDLSFAAAIDQWLLERIQKKHGIKCRVITGEQAVPLGENSKVVLFRALRELAVNVVKHAKATALTVTIEKLENTVQITCKDDGLGFAPPEDNALPRDVGGFGLFNIKERLEYLGGGMKLESAPGRGTLITLSLPLERKNDADADEGRQ